MPSDPPRCPGAFGPRFLSLWPSSLLDLNSSATPVPDHPPHLSQHIYAPDHSDAEMGPPTFTVAPTPLYSA